MENNNIKRNYSYWKDRCEAAEKVISETPCDPDITKDQIAAYEAWEKAKREPYYHYIPNAPLSGEAVVSKDKQKCSNCDEDVDHFISLGKLCPHCNCEQ